MDFPDDCVVEASGRMAGFPILGLCLAITLLLAGCVGSGIRPPPGRTPSTLTMEVTGYCNCGICCGWERSWLGWGPPVYSSGPSKGKPKQVGITASGTQARHGTVAADTRRLPFGTIVYVPGYGYGRVEDRGSAITDLKLDLWFSSHTAARHWGRQKVLVKVWLP